MTRIDSKCAYDSFEDQCNHIAVEVNAQFDSIASTLGWPEFLHIILPSFCLFDYPCGEFNSKQKLLYRILIKVRYDCKLCKILIKFKMNQNNNDIDDRQELKYQFQYLQSDNSEDLNQILKFQQIYKSYETEDQIINDLIYQCNDRLVKKFLQNSVFLDWQAILLLNFKQTYGAFPILDKQGEGKIIQCLIRLYNWPQMYIQNPKVLLQIFEFQAAYFEQNLTELIVKMKEKLSNVIEECSLQSINSYNLNEKYQQQTTILQNIIRTILRENKLKQRLQNQSQMMEFDPITIHLWQRGQRNRHEQFLSVALTNNTFNQNQLVQIQKRISYLINLFLNPRCQKRILEHGKISALTKRIQRAKLSTIKGFEKIILVSNSNLVQRIRYQLNKKTYRNIQNILKPLQIVIQKVFQIFSHQAINECLRNLDSKSMKNWNIHKQAKEFTISSSISFIRFQFDSYQLKVAKYILKKGLNQYLLNQNKQFQFRVQIFFTNSQILSKKQTRKLIKIIQKARLKPQKISFDNCPDFDCQYLVKKLKNTYFAQISQTEIVLHQPIQKLSKVIDESSFFQGKSSIFLRISNSSTKLPSNMNWFANVNFRQKIMILNQYLQFVRAGQSNNKFDQLKFLKFSKYIRIMNNSDISSLTKQSLFSSEKIINKISTLFFQYCYGLQDKQLESDQTIFDVIAKNFGISLRVLAIKDSLQQLTFKAMNGFKNLNALILKNCQQIDVEAFQKCLVNLSKLEHLNLSQNCWVSDLTVQCICQLKQIKFLGLLQTGITDYSLRLLQENSKLQSFVCGKTKVNGQAIVRLVKKCKKLKKLNIVELTGQFGYGMVNDSDLCEIACQQQDKWHLTHLNIDNCHHISDQGIGYFHKLKFISMRSILDMKISEWQKNNLKKRGIEIRQ